MEHLPGCAAGRFTVGRLPFRARQQQPQQSRGALPGLSRRQHTSCRRVATHAADPYQVLGISSAADSDGVSRAYKAKLKQAGDDSVQRRAIEEAHSSIMMSALTARLQGGSTVPKEIRYADKAQIFPWRPRQYQAPQKIILFHTLAQAACLAIALLDPLRAGQQPIVYSAVAGGAGNLFKLNGIFPSKAPDPENPERFGQGAKNILRAGLLALIATFLGCAVLYTIPDNLVNLAGRQLPYWFYDAQNAILCTGTVLANWTMTAFYR